MRDALGEELWGSGFSIASKPLVYTAGAIGRSISFRAPVGIALPPSHRDFPITTSGAAPRSSTGFRRDPAQPRFGEGATNGKGRTTQRNWRTRMAETGERRVESMQSARDGRTGSHRPSEGDLHPTRSSDVLPQIARVASFPTVPHAAKTRRNVPRRVAPAADFERNDEIIDFEISLAERSTEMESIGPRRKAGERTASLVR